MIVGTAGHIDHGKTTLVRALTGVDTDRLPEEKRRGISIELGYAFLDTAAAPGALGAPRIGFIDVPGHERLVHTMLAGATGIDFALLLVAADDGVMPQTREHLAVLSLLGLSRGVVAVTKADRVEAPRLAAVVAEARALLAPTPLAQAPVLPVSAATGEGVGALRALLIEAAAGEPRPADEAQAFRLAIDRAFTLDGVGTVVTGTVHAGCVRIGDELALSPPSPGMPARARVRSLHAQNRPVTQARCGERCALALAGWPKEAVRRGQWLTAPEVALATDRLDAELTLWHAEEKPLRPGTPVVVHLGAAAVPGSVALLDAAGALPPGARARVQLVLREPVGAWHGERLVLRDASASRTLAGGHVLDPFAPARYRRTPQRLAELEALSQATPGLRLAARLGAAPQGLDLARFAAAEGLGHAAALALPLPQGTLAAPADAGSAWAAGAVAVDGAEAATLAALASFHQRSPDEPGPDAARLRRLACPRLAEPLWRALLGRLAARGVVLRRASCVQLPEHAVQLSATEQRIAQKLAPLLAAGRFDGDWARDLARDAHESEALMRATLARLAQQGELHQVVKDLYYAPATMNTLAALARQVAAAQGGVVMAAAFRDATGLGRKRSIQILEYFDRIGWLRRVGDAHRLRQDSALFADEAASA